MRASPSSIYKPRDKNICDKNVYARRLYVLVRKQRHLICYLEEKGGVMRLKIQIFILPLIIFSAVFIAEAQQETYTGSIVSYGTGIGARLRTGTFTMTIDSLTSDQRANQLLGLLQEGSEEALESQVDKEDVGRFSVDGNVGPRINVVRESTVNGQTRIFAVFRRWESFGELRGGYRSTDYPFGVIELYVDPATGKGSGTYIAAARIRWRQDKKSGQNTVEIENFATYPAQLLGVERHAGR